MFRILTSFAGNDLSAPGYKALILLWAVLTLACLGIVPLFDYDEASYAQTAVELARSGHWLLPSLNNQPYYDKPAFIYYCMNASFALFGRNAFAARLPSALFTLATALLLVHAGRRIDRRDMGLTAGLIFLSMLMPAILGHAAILDAALNFFIAASILYFFLWRVNGRRSDAVIAMLSAGIAVSVKGPVGIVVPALVIGLDWLPGQDLSPGPRRFPWGIAVPAFLLGALPWYALVTISYGFGFLAQFVLRENIQRFLRPFEGHSGGWYYYLLVLIPSSLPWLAWLPWWIKRTLSAWNVKEQADSLSRLCLVWAIAVIALFSLAGTKLPHYTAGIYPAVALGIAAAGDRQQPSSGWSRAVAVATVLFFLPFALMMLLLPVYYPHFAQWITYPRVVEIFSQGGRPFRGIAIGGAVIALALVPLAIFVIRGKGPDVRLLFILFGFVVQTSLIGSLAPLASDLMQKPAMEIAARIRTAPFDEPVYTLVNRPSIAFYSKRTFVDAGRVDLGEQFSKSPAPCLLVAYASQLEELSRLRLEPVAREGSYVLLRYTPFTH